MSNKNVTQFPITVATLNELIAKAREAAHARFEQTLPEYLEALEARMRQPRKKWIWFDREPFYTRAGPPSNKEILAFSRYVGDMWNRLHTREDWVQNLHDANDRLDRWQQASDETASGEHILIDRHDLNKFKAKHTFFEPPRSYFWYVTGTW